MAEIKCMNCGLRAKNDKNPKSLLGRFWKWHTGWCPGWKNYLKSLSESEKTQIIAKYK